MATTAIERICEAWNISQEDLLKLHPDEIEEGILDSENNGQPVGVSADEINAELRTLTNQEPESGRAVVYTLVSSGTDAELCAECARPYQGDSHLDSYPFDGGQVVCDGCGKSLFAPHNDPEAVDADAVEAWNG